MTLQIWNSILRAALIMSLSGSAITLLILSLKPLLRNRFPKSVQYYLWLVALITLLIPFSTLLTLPDKVAGMLPVPATSIYTIVSSYDFVGTETVGELTAQPYEVADMPALSPRAPNIILRFIMRWYWTLWPLGAAIFFGINITGYMHFLRRLRKFHIPPSSGENALLTEFSAGIRPLDMHRRAILSKGSVRIWKLC